MKLLISFIFCLATASAGEGSHLWGKIIEADHMNYKYFVTYEDKGQIHAYPLETSNNELIKEIKKNVSELVKFTGQLKTKEIQSDGRKQIVPVFIPETLAPLKLSQLSINDQVVMEAKNPKKKEKDAYNGGGIRVNDKLANTLIITTGAILIGSGIYNSLKKK